ncbi:unnamed protein product [Kluyveromyces dobzhanskii CBS 2104]|uniref:WGS project CCBQ000000000 data, contig 00102 n=1 Tax=Kluyveromyces dobzhanskii CBS 2104 TaxID=1427455 RepID=A0A0A8L6F0_9SACH|nr:unnamed protein product [Kluyveromyces dobzhanskii CBS 2104]
MSDNIARNKSQRWVSASKANYDGADWDASSSNSEDEDSTKDIPELPQVDSTEAQGDEKSSTLEPASSLCLRSDSQSVSMRSGSKSVNEDLDSLMHQISQEMSPRDEVNHTNSDSEDNDEDDIDLEVSKTGYFAAYVQDEESDETESVKEKVETGQPIDATHSEVEISQLPKEISMNPIILPEKSLTEAKEEKPDSKDPTEEQLSSEKKDTANEEQVTPTDVSPITPATKDKEGTPDGKGSQETTSDSSEVVPVVAHAAIGQSTEEENNDTDSLLNDYGSDPTVLEDTESTVRLRQTSRTDLSYRDAYSSDGGSLEDEEHIIPEVSLGHHVAHSAESFKFRNPVRDSVLDSSDDDLEYTDDDGDLEAATGGYFNAMVHEDNETEKSDNQTPSDNNTDHETADSDHDSIAGSLHNQLSRSSITQSINSTHTTHENVKDYSDSSENEEEESKKMAFSTRESINLGKWKPDTDAFRSGFVTETIDVNNPPEGYTVDEEGNIVERDENPSSAVHRSVSAASDGESQFNAFPHDAGSDDEDLKTIADTKTLYDNQTIYNVPAVIANNVSAPALPTNIQISNGSTDFVSSNDTILKHIDGQAPKSESRLKESFKSEKDETSSVPHNTAIPKFDIVKLLEGKEQHSQKLKLLNDYREELKKYDSGLQGWINYALRSSDVSDKDFIFKDYKVNKHVQDAYAQADVLSKKNSVANTVNQNVTHLKKKMFSSSMREKSKGLFSSIGKKL